MPRSTNILRQRESQTATLTNLLKSRFQQSTDASALDTAQFAAGRGALSDLLQQFRRRDAMSASARGLTGSPFEIAQSGARQQTAASILRNVLASSEAGLRADRQMNLQGLLGFNQQQNQLAGSRAGLERDREKSRAQNLFSALSLVPGLVGAFGGPGGKT